VSLHVRLKEGHTVEVIRRFADDFTATTGIELRLDIVPEGRAHDDLFEAGPDVVTVPFWYLDELVERGALRPVTELVPAHGLGWEQFAPAAVAALTRQGQRWAVPHTLTGGVLSYRTDLLEEIGLDPPATTLDVVRIARSIAAVRADQYGLVGRATAEFSSLETYAGWAWANGIKLLPDRGDPDPAQVEAAVGDLVATLRETGPADLTGRSYAQVGDLMLAGRAAQLFDTSAWGYFFDDPAVSPVAGRIGYTTIRGSTAPAQFLYAEGLGITSWSTRADEAARFLAWRHSPPIVEREVRVVGRVDLPRLDIWDMDWYAADVTRRGLTAYLAVVRRAWEEADMEHVAKRPDFVAQARALMRAIAATVAGRSPDVAAALNRQVRAADRG
jgi:multiple sugar transport system substrate-binding protein